MATGMPILQPISMPATWELKGQQPTDMDGIQYSSVLCSRPGRDRIRHREQQRHRACRMESSASLKSFSKMIVRMNMVQLRANCRTRPKNSEWNSALSSQLAIGDERILQILSDDIWQH